MGLEKVVEEKLELELTDFIGKARVLDVAPISRVSLDEFPPRIWDSVLEDALAEKPRTLDDCIEPLVVEKLLFDVLANVELCANALEDFTEVVETGAPCAGVL